MDKNTKMLSFGLLLLFGLVFASVPALYPNIGYVIAFILAILALILTTLAFSVKYYDYLIFPFLNMKKLTAVISNEDPFYISPNGNAIVVRGDGAVYASTFVKIPIYVSASEMLDEEKLEFALLFSRVASLSKTPMKLSAQFYVVNKDQYLKRITEKLNQVQDLYNRAINMPETPKEKLERVKGEVTMWHNLHDNVSRTQSKTLATYAMVTSAGGTEEEAVNLAMIKGEELAAGISSLIGVTASLAREEELLVLIEPDYMIPSITVDEMMQAKATGEGMV